MSAPLKVLEEQRVVRAREALQRARELRHSRRVHGVDGIRQFVKDVDGDWLDNWTDTTVTRNNHANRTVLVLKLSRYVSITPFLFVLSSNQENNPCLEAEMRALSLSKKIMR